MGERGDDFRSCANLHGEVGQTFEDPFGGTAGANGKIQSGLKFGE